MPGEREEMGRAGKGFGRWQCVVGDEEGVLQTWMLLFCWNLELQLRSHLSVRSRIPKVQTETRVMMEL